MSKLRVSPAGGGLPSTTDEPLNTIPSLVFLVSGRGARHLSAQEKHTKINPKGRRTDRRPTRLSSLDDPGRTGSLVSDQERSRRKPVSLAERFPHSDHHTRITLLMGGIIPVPNRGG